MDEMMNEINTNEITDVVANNATSTTGSLVKTVGIGALIAAAVTGAVLLTKKLIKKHKQHNKLEVVDDNEPVVVE